MTPDPKPGPARRTYASLYDARGFQLEAGSDVDGHLHVSIGPMATRSRWRYVAGSGRPTSRDALYEEVGL